MKDTSFRKTKHFSFLFFLLANPTMAKDWLMNIKNKSWWRCLVNFLASSNHSAVQAYLMNIKMRCSYEYEWTGTGSQWEERHETYVIFMIKSFTSGEEEVLQAYVWGRRPVFCLEPGSNMLKQSWHLKNTTMGWQENLNWKKKRWKSILHCAFYCMLSLAVLLTVSIWSAWDLLDISSIL